MNEMLNTFVASYGVVVTIILATLALIFAISTILLPLFVWGIHNQTVKATRELARLNQSIELLRIQPASYERITIPPIQENRAEDRMEETVQNDQPETFDPEPVPELHPQAFKPRKVFIKPDEEVKDRRQQAG